MQEFISYNIATMVVKRTGIYQHRENDRLGEPYDAHIAADFIAAAVIVLCCFSILEHGGLRVNS